MGMLVHGNAIIDGVVGNLFAGSFLVDMYLNFGKVGYTYMVFDGILERDAVLWNKMISGLVRKGWLEDGIKVFCDMVVRGSLFI